MEAQILPARKSDVERIQELNAELSEMEAEEYDPTIDSEWTLTDEAAGWYMERIKQGNGFAKVVEDGGRVTGYAIGITGSAEVFRTIGALAELETMYLQPKYRGHGTGSELIKEFKDWAEERDADSLRVEASVQNKGAIRFYRETGFEDYSVTLEEDF
jgi:GNAT superfamily N-acetyltransferase